MPIMTNTLMLSENIMRCNTAAKKLLGDEYEAKIKQYKDIIQKVQRMNSADVLEATIAIVEIEERANVVMMFLSAASDLINQQ